MGDRIIELAVAIALAYLVVSWGWRRRKIAKMAPPDRPVLIPAAVPVWTVPEGNVMLPGSIWPFELRRPESQAMILGSHKGSGIIGVATDVPEAGRVVCAARVLEARRDGDKVAAMIQGVARIRLIAEQRSGKWTVKLLADSKEATDRVHLAAERIRQLALRVVDQREVPADFVELLRSTTVLTGLVDLATGLCDLPRETQTAVLTTEDLPERFAIVRKALEERAARG